MPSLFSFFPGLNPGIPFSRINALIPCDTFDFVGDRHGHAKIRVVAIRRKRLRPIQHPKMPSRRAVVRVPPASEPASGSVNDQAPIFFPDAKGAKYFLFCASEPNL